MARIQKSFGKFFLEISEQEFKHLKLSLGKEYELLKAKDGLFVLVEKNDEEILKRKRIDEKIFKLIREKSLRERVEGKFEKLLTKEELERFKELLKENKIVPFKLSKKYAKAVYQFPEQRKKESESAFAVEKRIEDYSLEKDGFLVLKNEERVKKICQDFGEQIREGAILGIKSFDGYFYVIERELYNKYKGKVLFIVKDSKSVSLNEISRQANISEILARIVCELLKDEGELIEKRKNLFQFVQ